MNLIKNLALTICTLYSIVAVAADSNGSPQAGSGPAEQRKQSPTDTAPLPWTAFGSAFVTLGGKTDYDVTVGSTKVSTDDKSKARYQVAGALEYLASPHFSIGGELSYAPYPYKDTSDSDTHISLQAVPALRFNPESKAIAWFGMGLGYMHTSIGGSLSGSTAGYTLSLADRDMSSFIWSPRLGVDFDNESWVLRIQAEYNMTSLRTSYTLTNSSTGVKAAQGNIDASRKWWAIGLGYGWKMSL